MNNIFLVLGYGVPKNSKDKKYDFYLNSVFNKIYDFTVKNKISKPIIIFSGGNTDRYKPYKRNEADEMIKLFKVLKKRFFVKKITKDWILLPEKRSLSTLENFLNCKKIIINKKIKKANIRIFCEQTRKNRVNKLSKIIFSKNYKCCVISLDFNFSFNRYLDPDFIVKKEKTELKHCLWALQSKENLEKHHRIFEEKFAFLRKFRPDKHPDALKKYWEQKFGELEK